MCLTILILPLLSFLTTNLFGRYVGTTGSAFLAPISISLSFFLSIIVFYESVICSTICNVYVCDWFVGELLHCNWGFTFDSLSVVMLLVVCGVSSLVHLYSVEYMSADPHLLRFLGYLSLFTFFMLLLVTADNYLIMFLGWEGIGLASYLLISFWFNRIQAGKSAIKAMLVNRVGDVGLAIGISYVFLTFKTVDYAVVFALSPLAANQTVECFGMYVDKLSLIACFLFWGAVGKSAQLGLHIWLPDAMEGPTPVSALIHAATLVTAGVFLIIRCSALFECSQNVLIVVSLLGSLTSLFAATAGLVQNDLKRVIAYSTCSQLGYMVFACGLSHYMVALFHLANHAIFKALLFLSAGCVIHGMCDEQDLRRFGGLIRFLPVSYVMILIGSLALVGFPYLTGFYSKDVILELAAARNTTISSFAHGLGCLAAFCTSFYSFRLVYLTFINRPNTYKTHIQQAHDGSILMVMPLMILALGSLVAGFMMRDLMIGFGATTFQSGIYVDINNFVLIDSEFLGVAIKNIPLFSTIIGCLLATLFIGNNQFVDQRVSFTYKMKPMVYTILVFLSKKWHFDQLASETMAYSLLQFGYSVTFQLFDKGLIEYFGPKQFVAETYHRAGSLSSWQTGFVYQYGLVLVASFITILLVVTASATFNIAITNAMGLLVAYLLISS